MLSYADRLAELRKTKKPHTFEKKKQNGYTDLDDFGTVPVSEGYPDLVVRVTGFTVYFATLSPQFRQLVVDRFIEKSN